MPSCESGDAGEFLVVTDYDDQAIVAEWDNLAERSGASPFAFPGWVLAWWECFGRGQLELMTIRRAGRLCGLVPLIRRGRFRLISPTNAHTPTFSILTENRDPVLAQQLWRAILALSPQYIGISPISSSDTTARALEEASRPTRYRLLSRVVGRSPYVCTHRDWKEYQSQLGRHVLAELRRRRRRLAEQGAVELDIATGGTLDGLLEEGFRVESAGWKGASGTAIASRPETLRFYTDVASWAADRGWLRIALLRCAGRAVAFDLSFEHAGIHYLIKTGYDPEFRIYSPGIILRYDMIAQAFAEGLSSYEFLGRDEPWKANWASGYRELLTVEAYGRSPFASAHWLFSTRARPVLGRARRHLRGGSRASRRGE